MSAPLHSLARMAYFKRSTQNIDTRCTAHAYSNYVFQDLTPNAVQSKAMVLFLLIHCLLFFPFYGCSVFGPFLFNTYYVSFSFCKHIHREERAGLEVIKLEFILRLKNKAQ